MAHLFIAAAHKSSGKTTITTGLAGVFRKRGLSVQPFKKGPDYIDPMWLGQASDRPCYNLDFNTMSNNEISQLFVSRMDGADIGLIESNKGLYDGVDLEGSDSNAALAKLLRSPVILVIDTTGTTRGIVPLLRGYQVFDPDISIKGVILNKVGGPRHEGKLRAAVERYTDITVLGAVGRDEELAINERHMGLATPAEVAQLERQMTRLYDTISDSLEVDRLFDIAQMAAQEGGIAGKKVYRLHISGKMVRIGIARDSAFTFYYPDDLEALQRAGAELVFFDTLNDERLPDVDGVFIGGGFPETHMKALQTNRPMRMDLREKLKNGMPAYAECGGLMYMCESLKWRGERCEMVGAIKGDAVMCARPQGRGYSRLLKTENCPWTAQEKGAPVEGFPAHEFHFAKIENLAKDTKYAFDVVRGHGVDGRSDGIVENNLLAGFCHLRNSSSNPWASKFVDHVRMCIKQHV